jgi:hypothetical protein
MLVVKVGNIGERLTGLVHCGFVISVMNVISKCLVVASEDIPLVTGYDFMGRNVNERVTVHNVLIMYMIEVAR